MTITTTNLLYLDRKKTFQFEHDGAQVVSILEVEQKQQHDDRSLCSTTTHHQQYALVLNETIFHYQGGGQPSDTGKIVSSSSASTINSPIVFRVERVIRENSKEGQAIIKHIGTFESRDNIFEEGSIVKLVVNQKERTLNAALHSAGHLIDLAVARLGYNKWSAGKGYHFPASPYVEYDMNGQTDQLDTLVDRLNTELKNLIADGVDGNSQVRVEMVPPEQACQIMSWDSVPSYLPPNQPVRIVTYGNVSCPCSGTHVESFEQIGTAVVRKLKKKGNKLRISYGVTVPKEIRD